MIAGRWVAALVLPLLIGADAAGPDPSGFRFELNATPELHRLWETSSAAKAERVACLAANLEGDTVRISQVVPLDSGQSDSLGISAAASLDTCGPPRVAGHRPHPYRPQGRTTPLLSLLGRRPRGNDAVVAAVERGRTLLPAV